MLCEGIFMQKYLKYQQFEKQIQFNEPITKFMKLMTALNISKRKIRVYCDQKSNAHHLYFIEIIIKSKMESEKSYSRLHWTEMEQKLLKFLKEENKIESWKEISIILNKTFPGKNRTGKQCRQRYTNYVKFGSQNPKIVTWTIDEDLLLFQKFMKYESKWVVISKEMPGRAQNCLKNRFYGVIRKIIRKLNWIQREKRVKHKKVIKPEFIIKVLEFSSESQDLIGVQSAQKFEFIEKLKKYMIDIISSDHSENIQKEKLQKFIKLFRQYASFLKNEGKNMKNRKSLIDQKDSPQYQSTIDSGKKNSCQQISPQENQKPEKEGDSKLHLNSFCNFPLEHKKIENLFITMPVLQNYEEKNTFCIQNNMFMPIPYFSAFQPVNFFQI